MRSTIESDKAPCRWASLGAHPVDPGFHQLTDPGVE